MPATEIHRIDDTHCTIEEHHECDVSVGTGFLLEMVQDAGVAVPSLERIVEVGYTSDAEVRVAFQEAVERLADPIRTDAKVVVHEVYPDLYPEVAE